MGNKSPWCTVYKPFLLGLTEPLLFPSAISTTWHSITINFFTKQPVFETKKLHKLFKEINPLHTASDFTLSTEHSHQAFKNRAPFRRESSSLWPHVCDSTTTNGGTPVKLEISTLGTVGEKSTQHSNVISSISGHLCQNEPTDRSKGVQTTAVFHPHCSTIKL